MDTKDDRPNYFLLLGLDPDATWDDALFEVALGQCKKRWSRESNGIGSSRKTIKAKQNLRMVSEMQKTMRDPVARDRERSTALTQRAVRFQQHCHDVRRRLDIRLAKGFLYDVEVADLNATEQEALAADGDLARRLATADIRPMQPVAAPAAERLASEPSLKAGLKALRAKNLYDVLRQYDPSITPKAPRERLLEAADKLYMDGNTSSRKDAAVEAKQTLGGIAKSAFATESERRKHDNSMRLHVMDELTETYESALAAVQVVYAPQAQQFLTDALSEGIGVDEARDHLVTYFTGRKWRVELPGEQVRQALLHMVVCPRCHQPNEPDLVSCANCGLALRVPCPACGQTIPSAAGCGKCGFPTGEREWVTTLVEDAEQAVDNHDAATAARLLGTAERIWRLPKDHADALTERIAVVRSRIETARATSQKKVADARRTMAAGRYQEALHMLEAAPAALPDRAGLLAEAQRRVAAADELCRRSRVPGIPGRERARLLSEALRECADHTAARIELESIPPGAPGRLAAELDKTAASVVLTWTSSGEPDVRYVVTRTTSGRAPTSAGGGHPGERMEIVKGTRWVDQRPVFGRPLRYAVFTERGNTLSATPAVTPAAVFVMGEPDVRATPRDRGVDLAWTLPDEAAEVEIRRERIGGAEPGVALTPKARDRLPDNDLQNWVAYRYTVRAVYSDRTAPGGFRRSEGRSVTVTPHPTPEPQGPVEVEGAPPAENMRLYRHRVTLRWRPTPHATMHVVRIDGPASLRAGDQVPQADLLRHGHVFTDDPPVRDTWIEERRYCQYVPALVVEGIAYVGHARPYAAIDEVVDIRIISTGSVRQLRWNWPADADSVVVARGRLGDSAGLFRPGATTIVRSSRASSGVLDLDARLGADDFLLVAAGLVDGGVRYLTTGREVRVGDEQTVEVPAPRVADPLNTTTAAAGDPGSRRRRPFGKKAGSP